MNTHPWLAELSSWLWPNVLVHLWEATLFVGLLALGIRLLKRAPASTRYWFWLLAAFKLLVPSVLLAWLVSEIPSAAPSLSPALPEQSTHGAQAIDPGRPAYEILKPLLLGQPDAGQPVSAEDHNELYCALTLTWLAGFVFFAFRWARGSLSLAWAVKTRFALVSSRETQVLKRVRSWLLLNREVDILVSDKVTVAGLWGIRRPTVLLPEAAASRLSDEELEAVMLHELLHVERRDNLAVVLQKVITVLLWFYPLAWLIDRKLFEERERACDEEVVRLGKSPETYVSGVLKVARACVEQRLVGISSIGGASLKRRMKHLLSTEPPKELGTLERALIIGLVGGLAVFSLGAGFVNRDAYAAWSSSTNRYSLRIHTGREGIPQDVSAVVRMSGSECGPMVDESMRNNRMGPPPPTITLQQIEQSPELPISFLNSPGSPILITDAGLRAMKVERVGVYLLLPRVSLSSRTARKITAVRLKFRHAPLRRTVHAEMYQLDLEPHGSFSTDRMPGKRAQRFLRGPIRHFPPQNWLRSDPDNRVFHPYVIYFPIEEIPEDFTVGVLGVQFADGDTWGTVPARFPTPAPPRRIPSHALDFGSPSAFDTQPSSERVRVNEDEQRKKILYRLDPPCPSGAFSIGIEGLLVLEASIGKDGSVQALRTIDGEPRLYGHVAASVVDAVKQWKYKPTLRQGELVEVGTTITIKFVLDPPGTG